MESGARRSRESCSCAASLKPRPIARTSIRCCRRWASQDRDRESRSLSHGRCRSRKNMVEGSQGGRETRGNSMKIRLAAVVLIALAQLAGCGGGGGGSSTPPPPTYTIGGAIAGLTGSGLVLQLNGGGSLSVNPNATGFTFTVQLASGAAY